MDYLLPAAVTLVAAPLSMLALLRAANPKPPKTAEAMKLAVLNFVKQGSLLVRMKRKNTKPGEMIHSFQSATGLCYQTYDIDRLTVDKNYLAYNYKLAPGDKLTPGLGTALMDEIAASLMGLMGRQPGASLFFQMQWFPENIIPGDDHIDLVNTLTKNGRTISHTRTDILSSDKKVIGYSTHVKYMPSDFLTDTILSNFVPWMSPWLCENVINKKLPPPSPDAMEKVGVHKVVDAALNIVEAGKGEFSMTDDHKNSFGTLHGGVSVMIMEKVGDSYANSLLPNQDIDLVSIQVHFLAAGRGQKTVSIECETIELVPNSHALIRVNLMQPKKGKPGVFTTLSQGTLKYVMKA